MAQEEKTVLEKFKALFSAEKMKEMKQLFDTPAAIVPKVQNTFVDVKTTDGAVLRIDGGTQAGSKCTLISAEGETPADGAYTLEDGTALSVKAGVIEAVTPAAPAAEDPSKMNELAEVKESVKSITYKYAEIEKALADQVAASKEAFEKVTKDNEKLSAQNKAMFALIEQLAGLPTEEPAQAPAAVTKKGRFAEFREDVKAIQAERKKLRN